MLTYIDPIFVKKVLILNYSENLFKNNAIQKWDIMYIYVSST